MRIGSGWTKNSKDGDTFISISIDEAFLELYPQLKNCNLTLGWVKETDKKKENSPSWTVNLSAKKKKEDKDAVKKAEEEIVKSAETITEEPPADLISEEDIPFL